MSTFRQQLKDEVTTIQSSLTSIPVQPHTHKYSHEAENLSGKSECYIDLMCVCVCVFMI